MRFSGKLTSALAAGLIGAALAVVPVAQADATPSDAAAAGVSVAAYSDCRAGYICFWSERNGTGQRCQWSENAPNARPMCSWMNSGTNARSVYNRTGSRFHYYHRANYVDRIGSTVAGDSGNLAGTYTIGSLCAGSCPR
ncbi:peptidase inhibitor family I36 protein [Streptomyces sp. NPDC004838]